MNHCPPCNHDCQQSDTCPSRTGSPHEPAVVAPAKSPVRKFTCAELGVCHCETPGHCVPDVNPDDPDGVWIEVSNWGSHMLVGVMTVFVVLGSAGYLISWFGG